MSGKLTGVGELLGRRFARAEPRERVVSYVRAQAQAQATPTAPANAGRTEQTGP